MAQACVVALGREVHAVGTLCCCVCETVRGYSNLGNEQYDLVSGQCDATACV